MLLLYGGDHGASLWPWTVLHHLPVFSSSQNPSRAIIPFVLEVGALAGFGFDWALGWLGKWAAPVLGIFIALPAANCLMVDYPIVKQVLARPFLIGDGTSTFNQVYRPFDWRLRHGLEL